MSVRQGYLWSHYGVILDFIPFALGLVMWSNREVELGTMEEGGLLYRQAKVEGVQCEARITICLPFYGMMTPVGLLRTSDTTEDGPCRANSFCLVPNVSSEFICKECGGTFHVDCVKFGPSGAFHSACGCETLGTDLRR